MAVDNFSGPNPPYPKGAITVWTGSVTNIPMGWMLCDGNNNTPNMLDKFPQSVPNGTTDPGMTGGENVKQLSVSTLPSHSHSESTDSQSDHTHTENATNEGRNGGNGGGFDSRGSGTGGNNGTHSHTYTTSKSGSSSGIDNKPPYHEVAFIQKV